MKGNRVYKVGDKKEFFATNDWVRNELYSLADGMNIKSILDPCCGKCGLEDFEKGYDYTLIDVENRDNREDVILSDFLKWNFDKKFDLVVVNPPFSLTDEFIKKSWEYSDDILLIAPLKYIMKNYTNNIVDMKINWRYSYKCFGILTSVGLFHLNKNKNKKFSFGLSQLQTYNSLVERYFLPKADDFFSNHVKFEEKLSCKDKPFLLIKVTKARIVRDEPIFYDNDIHEAGDESAFIAESANVNVKKGSKIKRFLIYFDTVDDIKKFIQFYNDNSDYIRNYCYEYGSTVLRMNRMPYIHYDGEIKHA